MGGGAQYAIHGDDSRPDQGVADILIRPIIRRVGCEGDLYSAAFSYRQSKDSNNEISAVFVVPNVGHVIAAVLGAWLASGPRSRKVTG